MKSLRLRLLFHPRIRTIILARVPLTTQKHRFVMGSQKPRVATIRKPQYIWKDYLTKFEEDFDFHVR